MVVDDEPAVRELIATILRLEGHIVTEAGDGHDALLRIDRDLDQLPELILLDLMMPRMGGWRFLETLYRRGLRKRTRVLIITGEADPDQPGTAGATAEVLTKPFDVETLLRAVERALDRGPDELCARRDRSDDLVHLIAEVDRSLR
jgi:CheY-like chemotaxis protein